MDDWRCAADSVIGKSGAVLDYDQLSSYRIKNQTQAPKQALQPTVTNGGCRVRASLFQANPSIAET